jgi:hypothetical protein
MTATRRLAQANGGFLPTATSTVAKLPQWGRRPTLSHTLTIPASAPSVPPNVRPQRRGDRTGRDYAVRGKVNPIRIERACSPPTHVSSGAGGNRGSQMEWIIESYDRRTDRDGQNRFTSESAFISAAEELLGNIWKGFVSATLPDGRVLDEAAMRALVARASANR